nr:helix-turn-helix domain-containing protein [Meiothermus taiwanensis]
MVLHKVYRFRMQPTQAQSEALLCTAGSTHRRQSSLNQESTGFGRGSVKTG